MRKRSGWYWKEYKEEWDKFLADRPEKWQKVSTGKGDSLGVYETYLSPFVALRIGTSINCGDRVCDYAQASIKTYLYAVGGACATIPPSRSRNYLNGILSNTQHSTGVKWRKRIDTWKRQVSRSISAAILEYKSDSANFDRLAQNANRVCSGETVDVSQSRELLRLRATYFALDTVLKQQQNKGSDFGVEWLESGLAQVTDIANRVKKTGVVDPGAKRWVSNTFKHRAFGRQLLQIANSWLSRNSQDSEFIGKLANTFRKIRAGVPNIEDNGILDSFQDPSWKSVLDGSYGLSIPYVESIGVGKIEEDKEDGILYVDIVARVPYKVKPWWVQGGNPLKFFMDVERFSGASLDQMGFPWWGRSYTARASQDWGPNTLISLFAEGQTSKPNITVYPFTVGNLMEAEYQPLVDAMTKRFSKKYTLSVDLKTATKELSDLIKEMDSYAEKLFGRYS